MKKLLKAYSFNDDMQYFEMIVDSFLNGQRSQAWEQFNAMPKKNKVEFLKAATVGDWQTGLGDHIIKQLFDLI
jgi:hypothetical protein